jgi:phenylacetate-CoA ligase
MPLLRYQTGDQVVLRETHTGYEITEMVGRIHDLLEVSGRRFPTHYIQDILDRMGMVRQFQISRDSESLTFYIVPEDHADQNMITSELQRWTKAQVEVKFIPPDAIKLTGHRQKFRHLVQR